MLCDNVFLFGTSTRADDSNDYTKMKIKTNCMGNREFSSSLVNG